MIDDTLFVAAGPSLRSFSRSALIAAERSAVFAAWTTTQGIEAFLGVSANVELRIGGAFELYFMDAEPGQRGSEGCQILSYIPNQMLSFSWNAPPQFAEREQRTWVVVRLRDTEDGQTRVHLTHAGFGEGGQWDEVYTYFERAWEGVLKALTAFFAPTTG